MRSNLDSSTSLLIALGTAALVCAWLAARLRASRPRRRLEKHVHRARRAETDGCRLARSHGYKVLAQEVLSHSRLIVDGVPQRFPVRADLLLARGRRRYVGEIKSGPVASRPENRSTRRQLMEYAHAFQVDGVLLFDMEKHRIREISIPAVADPRFGRRRSFILGTILGAMVLFGVQKACATLTYSPRARLSLDWRRP
jgi:hypothetical protein